MARQDQGLSPERSAGLGTFLLMLLFAVLSLASFLTDHTGWLLLTGLGFIWGFMRLLPTRLNDQKGLIALFLALLLLGYWASYHLLTQERVLFLVNTLPAELGVHNPVTLQPNDPGAVRITALTLGTIFAIVVLIPLLLIAGWISVRWILALHAYAGVSVGQAWVYIVSLLTGIHQPYHIIENGRKTSLKPKGILSFLGGPGIVVIRPGYAATFEWSGEVSQIARPGVVRTRRFEKVAKILDLRPQWVNRLAENVLTQDRVPLLIRFGVGFQLGRATQESREANLDLEEQMKEVYPVADEDLFRAAYRLPGKWDQVPPAVAELMLRRAVASYTYEELMDWKSDGLDPSLDTRLEANPIKRIEEHVRKRLEEAAQGWGMRITGFTIMRIEVPEEVREEMVTRRWRNEAMVAEAEARAEALGKISSAKLEAWQKMLDRVLDTIKQADATQEGRIAVEYITLLERIEVLEEMARQGKLRMPHSSGTPAPPQE